MRLQWKFFLGNSSFATAALQGELFPKLVGYISGQTTPGAIKADDPPIYFLQIDEQTGGKVNSSTEDVAAGIGESERTSFGWLLICYTAFSAAHQRASEKTWQRAWRHNPMLKDTSPLGFRFADARDR